MKKNDQLAVLAWEIEAKMQGLTNSDKIALLEHIKFVVLITAWEEL